MPRPPTRTADQPEGSLTWRVAFAATLTLAMGVSAFTQFALGVLAPFLRSELGLSRAQLGSLTTVLFVVGGLGAPVAGRLVDALGGRRGLVLQFCAVGAAWAGMAAAPSYLWLLGTVAVAGLARGASNPVGNQLVAAHVARGRQGVLLGVSKSGAQVGALIAGVGLPVGALALGWRGVMLAAASLAGLGVLATLLVVPAHADRLPAPDPSPVTGRLNRGVLRLAAYAFFMGMGSAAVGAYLPLYAHEEVGLSVTRAGLVAGLIGFVGIIGRIAWAKGGERMRSPALPLAMLGAVSSASGVALLSASEGGHPVLLWIGATVYGLSAGSWIALGMLAVIRVVHVDLAGRASGVVLGAFYGGFAVSPALFGYTVDVLGSYRLAWLGVVAAFGCAAAIAGHWHAVTRHPQVSPGRA